MGLLDLIKPKWQHSNAEVRLEAVRSLDYEQDLETINAVIREDDDPDVRHAAILRLREPDAIAALLAKVDAPLTRAALRQHRNQLLFEAIIGPEEAGGLELLDELEDSALLARIAVEAASPQVRCGAVERISDPALLCEVIENNCGKAPALIALDKITDEEFLARLAASASSKTARRLAGEKLAARRQESSDPALESDRKFAGLLDECRATLAAGTVDLEETARRIAGLKEKWRELDTSGSHPLNEQFLAMIEEFDREYAAVHARLAEEKSKADEYSRQLAEYEQIITCIDELCANPEPNAAENFAKLEAQWRQFIDDPTVKLKPTAVLRKRFTAAAEKFKTSRRTITGEQALMTEKQATLTRLAESVETGAPLHIERELSRLEQDVARLSLKFLDKKTLTDQLAALRKQYTARKSELEQAAAEARETGLNERRAICAEIVQLIDAPDRIASEKKFKTLRLKWNNLAKISGLETEELEKQLQEAVTAFQIRQQEFFAKKDWELWANKTMKEKLIAEVEQLDARTDLEQVFNAVKELQTRWKQTGPAPKELSQPLWERFHSACERNFARCKPYLAELDKRKEQYIAKKIAICEEVEQICTSTDWNVTADRIKTLQTEWKNMGFATPRKKEDELFSRFRKACNTFFERRHQNFEEQDTIRRDNLVAKEKLCEEAEKLADQPQWEDREVFRQLQTQWKTIGHVPRNQEKQIWQRFRAACDQYFSWLDGQRRENLKRKEALCGEVESLTSAITEESDLKVIADQLAALQAQWKEIGPIPKDLKDALWERFHTPCDRFFMERKRRFAEADQERKENLTGKEELLKQAEELATADPDDAKAKAALQDLQKKWKDIGPVPRDRQEEINRLFKAACDCFFEGRRQHYEELHRQRNENLKKKEELCLRLEHIVGIKNEEWRTRENKALTLAEELKLAMEENFVMAGHKDDNRLKVEEVKRLRNEWNKIDPVSGKMEQALRDRYKKALDAFYEKNRHQQGKQETKK